jgi:rubrerythrin
MFSAYPILLSGVFISMSQPLFSSSTARRMSRRGVVLGGAIAGVTTALGLAARPSEASFTDRQRARDAANDARILNGALFYEHEAIWAYGAAAPALSDTAVGQAVLALALKNQADHMEHRDTLITVIQQLGGTPIGAEDSYDISAYIERGDGNLDSDVNIAKLALALEVDAAIAYAGEVAQLKTPALVTAGAGIGAVEASHATAIRAAFISLGVDIDYVPASIISGDTRNAWIIPV